MKKSVTELEIERLNEVLNKRQRSVNVVREKIQALQDSKIIPELKKKYEGKFFKYRNSFSAGDSWWLYSHCILVKGIRKFLINQFETDTMGISRFSNSESEFSDHLFQIQITKKEYDRALKTFSQKVNKLSIK